MKIEKNSRNFFLKIMSITGTGGGENVKCKYTFNVNERYKTLFDKFTRFLFEPDRHILI